MNNAAKQRLIRLEDKVRRYARSHKFASTEQVARRFGITCNEAFLMTYHDRDKPVVSRPGDEVRRLSLLLRSQADLIESQREQLSVRMSQVKEG